MLFSSPSCCMCVRACVGDYVRACVREWLCVHACRKSSPLVESVAQVHLVVAMMKGLRLQLVAVVLARAVASQVLRKPAMTLCRSMQHYEPPLCRLCAAHFYAFVQWCGYLFQCMLCYVMTSPRTSLKNTWPSLLLLSNRVQGASGFTILCVVSWLSWCPCVITPPVLSIQLSLARMDIHYAIFYVPSHVSFVVYFCCISIYLFYFFAVLAI